MTTPQLEEDGILREWAPLSYLLQEIPLRARRGLFLEDVKLTCVDAVNDCIVVGTSSGIVYWYDRNLRTVQPLSPEKNVHSVTCVKVASSVDFMVAAGDNNGIVTIFRIPKPPPDWLPQNKRETLDKSIERYTVGGLHAGPVTALEWSVNGQKLFSGDSTGIVIYTEIDFCMNLSKAREILNENYCIVQLSYSQTAKALIVSTVLRCTICFNEQNSWRVLQVGQKERNSLLALGGVFYCMEGFPSVPVVYSCRPGLRLWQANMNGSVQQTILFKEALKKCKNPVQLLRNVSSNSNNWSQCEFGRLLCWRDGLLVSHSLNTMLVIDPVRVAVVATLIGSQNIVSLATTQNELFLICGDRNLLRLAYSPDLNDTVGGIGSVATGEAVSSLPRFTSSPITGTILDLNFRVQPTNKLSVITPESIICASEVTYGTDSTLPPVIALHDGVTELRVDQSRFQQLNAIGEEGFDEIIYAPEGKVKSQKNKKQKNVRFDKGKDETKVVCRVETNCNLNIQPEISNSLNHLDTQLGRIKLQNEIPTDILPDFRSIDSIVEDVKKKEMLLEASLIFPINEGDLPRLEVPTKSLESNSNFTIAGNEIFSNDTESKNQQLNNITSELISSEHTTCTKKSDECELNGLSTSGITVVNQKINLSEIDALKIASSEHNIGNLPDPSKNASSSEKLNHNSSMPESDVVEDSYIKTEEMDLLTSAVEENITNIYDGMDTSVKADQQPKQNCDYQIDEIADYYVIKEASVDDGIEYASVKCHSPLRPAGYAKYGDWIELFTPDKIVSVCATKDQIIVCCPKLNVYSTSANLNPPDFWLKLDYKAQQFLVSSGGRKACRINCGIAHYSNNWEVGNTWDVLCRDVQDVSVTDNDIWYVTGQDLFHMSTGNNMSQAVLCDKPVVFVCADQDTVFVITTMGQIMTQENDQWRIIPTAGKNAKYLTAGPRNLIWLVDQDNNVYVTDNIAIPHPVWWQVIVGNGRPMDVSSICASEDSLYISNTLRESVYVNSNSVTGYRWVVSELDLNCLQLTAEGVFEDRGTLWILADSNQLLCGGPFISSKFQAISAPFNIVCIASTPQTFWALSDEGRIYIRHRISDTNQCGTQWWKLNLEQISKKVQFSHISCGSDVVWACDIRGKILMMVGSPHSVPFNQFAPVWVPVDGTPLPNNTFTKVYVGPQSHMVWALDNAGNVYVREAIFPDFLVGAGWVYVDGVKASHLSISGEAVWALSKTGVYKRIGISQHNFIGESWFFISAQLDSISASVSEGLWGICSKTGRLLQYTDKIFPVSSQACAENDWTLV